MFPYIPDSLERSNCPHQRGFEVHIGSIHPMAINDHLIIIVSSILISNAQSSKGNEDKLNAPTSY
jgi:hypothetical protein